MTATALEAPELAVNCWFNTDRPLNLAGLRGRVVALIAFQALCPQSVAVAIPQAKRIHETFEPNDVAVIGLHATFEHHEAYSHATLKAFIQETDPLEEHGHAIGAAGRTHNLAVRPAPDCKVVNAVIGIREVDDCLLKCLWFAHGCVPHKQNYRLN